MQRTRAFEAYPRADNMDERTDETRKEAAGTMRKRGKKTHTIELGRGHIAGIAGTLFLFSFVFLGTGENLILTMCGGLYPAYCTFKTLKAIKKTRKELDDERMEVLLDEIQFWGAYWVVYVCFMIVDVVAGWVLFMPGSGLLKCAFLLWLYSPQTKSAEGVFDRYLVPFLSNYETSVDQWLRTAKPRIAAMWAAQVEKYPALASINSMTSVATVLGSSAGNVVGRAARRTSINPAALNRAGILEMLKEDTLHEDSAEDDENSGDEEGETGGGGEDSTTVAKKKKRGGIGWLSKRNKKNE
jgi:hypothetical protein